MANPLTSEPTENKETSTETKVTKEDQNNEADTAKNTEEKQPSTGTNADEIEEAESVHEKKIKKEKKSKCCEWFCNIYNFCFVAEDADYEPEIIEFQAAYVNTHRSNKDGGSFSNSVNIEPPQDDSKDNTMFGNELVHFVCNNNDGDTYGGDCGGHCGGDD